ncbi:MAG: hypothetical protein R2792_00575 [Saprospiraceae bacterium]
MGLAISRSNPDVVYALVEAKDNALYKSTDGGKKWRKMADKNMGDRPFYYAEIYVDPQNENTVYSVHSQITKSIDGGRSFDSWVNYWRIHPDHHAFWINPNNPKHLIDGNDGGVNISFDGGDTWRFAENIPVGQFYHINVDNEIPYNVYGGVQDNGTFVGPSSVWKSGGLRNLEWQEVNFGDGFDCMPQRDNSRFCFAMSQGGEMSHIDRETGNRRYIKPLHPDGKTTLRWNWNAALAQDPFQDHGLYFGSQFVHYSPDLGHTWKLISPDLTTNDTAKLHQDISGGLTIDATNAENHCTIISIAPSPHNKDVIWVGTDDGQLQLTRDGGTNWTELSGRLPGFPKESWIGQIEVSSHDPGEVFVIVNNYRLNDWKPYMYHTKDFGKTWKRLASEQNIKGFCLSVVQDLEVPNLLFLGTDQGLYYSLDYGAHWAHWPKGAFPYVPVQDMKIHPREGDLVLGTYGRGIWVMDNIAPLRVMASKGSEAFEKPFVLFQPQQAVLASYASFNGPHFPGDETFFGDNKGPSGRIPVWVKPEQKKPVKQEAEDKDKKGKKKKDKKEDSDKEDEGDDDEKGDDDKSDDAGTEKKPEKGKRGDGNMKRAKVLIFNDAGDTLRQFTTKLDTAFSAIYWGLDTKGVQMPTNRKPREGQLEPGGGPRVLPGTYKVQVHYKRHMDSTTITVIDDPRLNRPTSVLEAEARAVRAFYPTVEKAAEAYDRLTEAEKTIKLVSSQFVNVPDSTKKEVLKLGKILQDSITALKDEFFTHESKKGIQRNPNTLNSKMWQAISYINNSEGAPNGTAQVAIGAAEEAVDTLVKRIDALFETDWKAYREKAEAIQYSLFKD